MSLKLCHRAVRPSFEMVRFENCALTLILACAGLSSPQNGTFRNCAETLIHAHAGLNWPFADMRYTRNMRSLVVSSPTCSTLLSAYLSDMSVHSLPEKRTIKLSNVSSFFHLDCPSWYEIAKIKSSCNSISTVPFRFYCIRHIRVFTRFDPLLILVELFQAISQSSSVSDEK